MEPEKNNPKALEKRLGNYSSNNFRENLIDGFAATLLIASAYHIFSNPIIESIQNTTDTIYNFCQTFSDYIDFLS
jgi:hypothetical protein